MGNLGLISFLSNTIDYAGTFPPAALSVREALRIAAHHRRQSSFPWILSKVVLPVNEIVKIQPQALLELGADGSPWLYNALGASTSANNSEQTIKTVEWDLRELSHWTQRWGESPLRQIVIGYELKWPDAGARVGLLRSLLNRLLDLDISLVGFHFEIPWSNSLDNDIHATCETIHAWKESAQTESIEGGLKFRTGGDYVPNVSELAKAISSTAKQGIRLKLTQGLHSALSHDRGFGFLNCLAAIHLCYFLGVDDFPTSKVQACLEDRDSSHFKFNKLGFSWKEYSMSIDEIEKNRRIHAASFGSCSLDEPVEELKPWVQELA